MLERLPASLGLIGSEPPGHPLDHDEHWAEEADTMLYTLGEWHVKPGHEAEFIAAWRELGAWTDATVPGNTWAKLLQDEEDPRRFISFGPWKDAEAVAEWRGHTGFQQRIANIQQLLESFVPHRMTVAAESGATTPGPR